MMLVHGLVIMAAVVGNVGDGPDAKVASLMKAWREKSQGWKTLEVRYEITDYWNGSEIGKGDGRLFLGPGDRMAKEETFDKDATRARRLVWSGNAIHQFYSAEKKHTVTAIAGRDRGKLPAEVRLPFLWGLDPESLHALYDIRIAGENDRVIGVVFKTRKVNEGDFETLYLELDRSTLLPWKATVVHPKKIVDTYQFAAARTGVPSPDEFVSTATPEGWTRPRLSLAAWLPPLWSRQGLLPR